MVRTFPALDEDPVRVLTCDDMPEMRELLRYFLDREPGTVLVDEARDGDEAVALAAKGTAEVIVLDLGMPGPPPSELVQAVHRADPDAAIVLYSGTPGAVLGAHRRLLAMEIMKGTPPGDVTDRIRELGRARRRRVA